MSEVPPVPWQTLPAMMRDVAARFAQAEAVVDADRRLDFGALHHETLRFASALAAAGIGPGDPVAIWASNGWRWVVAASGIWQAGGIVVPMASRWKAAEVGPLLERVGARVLIVEAECAGERLFDSLRARHAQGEAARPVPGLASLEHVVLLPERAGAVDSCVPGGAGPTAGARSAAGLGVRDWAGFLAMGEGREPPCDSLARGDAIAEILFTSGTTGAPKGVELAQAQLLQAYWDWSGIGGLRAGDRFLVIPPYSHGFGLNGGVLACWMRGGVNVPVAVFDPATTLEVIERERISVISGPPTLFATLMNRPDFDARKTRSLRTAFVGAASVPTELIAAMRERMGIERVINAYGLIEVCVVSMTRAEDPAEVIATTTGCAMPGVEVRLVGEDGADVGAGEPGEVWVRSPGVMRGYFRDPGQTAATIVAGGWCRTGDVGIRDPRGNIRVVDRLKDAYNCGGFSAYPAEIENQLLAWDEIAQVAVVGVPDARLGEVGHAFVVAKTGRHFDAEGFLAFARRELANYKVPRRVHRLDALPLNANGKVRKDELRRMARAASGSGG